MENITKFESAYPPKSFRTDKVLAYWIPIEHRDDVLREYRVLGKKIRLRYRGPRAVSIGREMNINGHRYTRTAARAYQDCLLEDATHFTVYSR